ncbi:hypothetical protein SEVIR_9G516350v4 [Setaria viridis]
MGPKLKPTTTKLAMVTAASSRSPRWPAKACVMMFMVYVAMRSKMAGPTITHSFLDSAHTLLHSLLYDPRPPPVPPWSRRRSAAPPCCSCCCPPPSIFLLSDYGDPWRDGQNPPLPLSLPCPATLSLVLVEVLVERGVESGQDGRAARLLIEELAR